MPIENHLASSILHLAPDKVSRRFVGELHIVIQLVKSNVLRYVLAEVDTVGLGPATGEDLVLR